MTHWLELQFIWRNSMNRITFWSIFLLGLINAAHCKKYLVEVADKQGEVTESHIDDANDEAMNDSKYFR